MKKWTGLCGGIGVCVIVSFLLFLILYGDFDWNVPMVYVGGDDTSYACEVKMMLDSNTWKKSEYIGAPYGTDRTYIVSYYLFNDAHMLSFLFVKLTGSVGMAINLTYITLFILNAIVAYLVMKSRKIDTVIAMIGSVVFAFLPYVFERNTSHMMLSAYEFVPVTLLLSLWIYEDDNFLVFKKGFFKYKRNWLAIVFAVLIANNGIGYYPVFSCMMILIAGISKSLKDRKWRGLLQSAAQIVFIVVSLLAVISGCLINAAVKGQQEISVTRNLADSEMYALKIARLFIPKYGSGIDWLDEIFGKYSNVAVYQTETTEFIGYFAIIGFIILMVAAFCRFSKNSKFYQFHMMAEQVICAILFGALGGFSVFFYLFITDAVRCTNRLSIYIAFNCIFAVCLIVSEIIKYVRQKDIFKVNKYAAGAAAAGIYFAAAIVALISIYYQKGASYVIENKDEAVTYEQDAEFVSDIEESVSDGAMVYQLPFISYQYGQKTEDMMPHSLFVPYLHSENLRWSFGSLDNERSTMLNGYISRLETKEMIDSLCYVGYEGIYIDSKAYKADDFKKLTLQIEEYLGQEPLVSRRGDLYFYNLSSYCNELKKQYTQDQWNEKAGRLSAMY